MTTARFPHMAIQHPEFDQSILPADIPSDWVDMSWRNDTVPRFQLDNYPMDIWMDDEVNPGTLTFCIDSHWGCDYSAQFQTQDFEEAKRVVQLYCDIYDTAFVKFQKTRAVTKDFKDPAQNYAEIEAHTYLGETDDLFIGIEKEGKYSLCISNQDWLDADLVKLERILFSWAFSERDLIEWPSMDEVRKAVAQ